MTKEKSTQSAQELQEQEEPTPPKEREQANEEEEEVWETLGYKSLNDMLRSLHSDTQQARREADTAKAELLEFKRSSLKPPTFDKAAFDKDPTNYPALS